MRTIRRIVEAITVSVALLVSTACGRIATSPYSGALEIDGSSTVFPISQAVAEEFVREHGHARISVGQSGTGGGFEKFCQGETDISDASREIEDDEAAACAANAINYIE